MGKPVGTISTDEAEDIRFGDPLAVQTLSEHRWYDRQLIVFKDGDELRGFYYLDPASELQEGQDRFESYPVEVFSVVAREVTTTIYELPE